MKKGQLSHKNYKTIDDYLPLGYSIDWDTTMSEDNDIVFDIHLLDSNQNMVEYWYCTPDNFNETIINVIDYAEKDLRNQKINFIIDENNKKM